MTAGEGGIVVTNDRDLYERTWSIANLGRRRDGGWYHHFGLGWNLRLTEFQAAMLLPQLDTLDEQSSTREGAAAYLAGELPDGLELVPRRRGDRAHLALGHAPLRLGDLRRTRQAGVHRGDDRRGNSAERRIRVTVSRASAAALRVGVGLPGG